NRSSVVLPDPFAPITPSEAPCATVRLTSRSASWSTNAEFRRRPSRYALSDAADPCCTRYRTDTLSTTTAGTALGVGGKAIGDAGEHPVAQCCRSEGGREHDPDHRRRRHAVLQDG